MSTAVKPGAVRQGIRACLPREHSLWVWGGAPLLLALLLAPSAGTAAGALSTTALFAAGNAWRAGARSVAGIAMMCAACGGTWAALLAASPALWAVAWFGGVGGVTGAILATRGRFGRSIPSHTALELLAIGGSLLVGGALAAAGDADLRVTALLMLTLWTWQVIGLWWVRGQLARVLVGRAPWATGPRWWGLSWVALGLAGLAGDAAAIGLLPAVYALRVWWTAPARSGSDVRRIGLSEAGWTGLMTAVAVAVVAGCP